MKTFKVICLKCGSEDIEIFTTIYETIVFECKNCDNEEIHESE